MIQRIDKRGYYARQYAQDLSEVSGNEGERKTKRERRGRRRGSIQDPSTPDDSVQVNPSTPPSSTTPTPSPSSSLSLAARYVAQYEKNAGVTLTDEARTKKVEEVTAFYSQPGREGRLNTIVFA